MSLFYKQFIESILSFCIVAWYGNLSLSNKNRLGSLVKVAGKIIGVNQTVPTEIYQNAVVKKAQVILCITDHSLHTEFRMLPSGHCFRVPACRTKIFKDSFVTVAIKLLNKSGGEENVLVPKMYEL